MPVRAVAAFAGRNGADHMHLKSHGAGLGILAERLGSQLAIARPAFAGEEQR